MRMGARNRQAGFTLVEMALVLVVIGLILGAVSIGKDMQRNAEYKKMKQKFVDQWVQVYNQYFDRTGHVIGDVEATPLMMVNGVEVYTDTSLPLPNPTARTESGPVLCGEAGTATGSSLQDFLAAAGIEPPPGRGQGFEDAYLYLDTNGNPQQATVCFQWRLHGATKAGTGNVMVISGLTPDVARFLDSAIDGQIDGQDGLFRRDGTDEAAADWPTGNDAATGYTDTAQVQVVTAVYRMNQ